MGVDAVNVHVRPATINSAFSLSSRGLVARPLLYGLVLFARTLGADPRLVRLHVDAPRPRTLDAWAVRVRGGALHVLLINTGRQPVTALLRLPARGGAGLQRLVAPSAASCSAVTLAGQRLNSQGFWEGRHATETIAPGTAGYRVAVPRLSAALVSLQLRRGTLR